MNYRFLVLALFLPFMAVALNLTPEGIQASVTAACDEVMREGLRSSRFDYWNAGQFKAQNFSKMVSAISHQSFLNSLQLDFSKTNDIETLVITSLGYKQGLVNCANRNRPVSLFLDGVVRSSSNKGKIVGAAALVIVFRGVGGLSARFSQWIGSASAWLAKASIGINYLTLAGLLRADSQVPEKIEKISVTDEDLKRQQMKNEAEFKRLTEDLSIVRKRIEACGKCSEEKMLEIYQATIFEALGIISHQTK